MGAETAPNPLESARAAQGDGAESAPKFAYRRIFDKKGGENRKRAPKGPWLMLQKANALHERNVLSSHGLHRSTFGDGRLNYRVRDGIG